MRFTRISVVCWLVSLLCSVGVLMARADREVLSHADCDEICGGLSTEEHKICQSNLLGVSDHECYCEGVGAGTGPFTCGYVEDNQMFGAIEVFIDCMENDPTDCVHFDDSCGYKYKCVPDCATDPSCVKQANTCATLWTNCRDDVRP